MALNYSCLTMHPNLLVLNFLTLVSIMCRSYAPINVKPLGGGGGGLAKAGDLNSDDLFSSNHVARPQGN